MSNNIIDLKIQKNDYVRPTEIRNDIVQKICDHIIKMINKSMWIEDAYQLSLHHKEWSYQLYINVSTNGDITGFNYHKDNRLNQIRVRNVEMDVVFDALQNAGYFIFGTCYTDGERKYTFSKKDHYDNRKACRMKFDVFID